MHADKRMKIKNVFFLFFFYQPKTIAAFRDFLECSSDLFDPGRTLTCCTVFVEEKMEF